MFPIPPRQDQYLQGQQYSSGYIAICRGEQTEWIVNLSTLTPFPRCGPNTLTLALGVPAQHLILVSKLDHLQDFSTPDTQVLATHTPGLGIGVNHHLCLNHNLTFKLGEHHVNMLRLSVSAVTLVSSPGWKSWALGTSHPRTHSSLHVLTLNFFLNSLSAFSAFLICFSSLGSVGGSCCS